MRLQVAIHRHGLPPVRLVFSTATTNTPGIARITTISDLLSSLNHVVLLESADGEWGLEDYVVEVAATSDQDNIYECFHYQLVQDVLREDDEVVVRGLSSEELRDRRQGGRLQITADGRHLIDGVGWGKKWRGLGKRPAFDIPPRKKRRLEPPDDENDEEEVLQLEYPAAAEVGTGVGDSGLEDDEDDGDFCEDEDDTQDEDSEDSADDQDIQKPLQITAHADFEDADEDSEESSELDDQEFLGSELQQLLDEAAEIDAVVHDKNFAKRKRERTSADGSDKRPKYVHFDGLSPLKTNLSKDNVSTTVARDEDHTTKPQAKLGPYPVVHPVHKTGQEVNHMEMHKAVESKSSSTKARPISKAAETDPVSSSDSDTTSVKSSGSDTTSDESYGSDSDSDSSSDPDSDSDSHVDDSSGGETDLSPSETDSSDKNGTTSDSDSASSNASEQQPEVPHKVKTNSSLSQAASNQLQIGLESTKLSQSTSHPKINSAPGSGSIRTKYNNQRTKLKKRLKKLKEDGIFDSNADFDTLREHELAQNGIPTRKVSEGMTGDQPTSGEVLATKKRAILEKLGAVDNAAQPSAVIAESTDLNSTKEGRSTDSLTQEFEIPSVIPLTSEGQNEAESTLGDGTVPESSPKRARLDIASSRRMLFSSLGLRNPKTPAAEQALREKLSQQIRTPQMKPLEEGISSSKQKTLQLDDSWRDKLIISAVECVQEGRFVPPPPFPFKQPWQIQKKDVPKSFPSHDAVVSSDVESSRTDTEHHKVANDQTHHFSSNENTAEPEVSINPLEAMTQVNDHDEFPIPEDFDALPDLSEAHLAPETIIAYKELHMNDRFQPEESPYRVAKVLEVNGDCMQFLLSPRDRDMRNVRYDESTGERIYGKFELPDDDEDETPDDGHREMKMVEMIRPKLVRRSIIENVTSASASHPSTTMSSGDNQLTVIPESAQPLTSDQDEAISRDINVGSPSLHEVQTTEDSGNEPVEDLQMQQNLQLIVSSVPNTAGKSNFLDRSSTVVNASISTGHTENTDTYQPAQRMSPIIGELDQSGPFDTHLETLQADTEAGLEEIEQVLDSMPPENSPSQIDLQPDQPEDLITNSLSVSSFLDHGSDGHKRSQHDGDDDSIDSNGLPSLRSLTSSQVQSNGRFSSHISPLVPHTTPRNEHQNRQSSPFEYFSPEQPPSSELIIKASQSPILSQARSETITVDLTISSDPVDQSDSAEESIRATRTQGRSQCLKNEASHGSQARMIKSSMSGLGSKRWLSKKKSKTSA